MSCKHMLHRRGDYGKLQFRSSGLASHFSNDLHLNHGHAGVLKSELRKTLANTRAINADPGEQAQQNLCAQAYHTDAH